MKKIIYILLGITTLFIIPSCNTDIKRGTQVPRNVIEVDSIGKIGRMAKYYDFREKFLPCWGLGFSDNDSFGRWCVDERGFMIFQVRKNATVTMKLDFVAFVSENHRENRIKAKANGVDCGDIVITRDTTVFLNFDQRHISNDNAVELELYPLNAKTPLELGLNGDGRKIGFGLRSVTLWAYYPVE